jgi:DNA recombination-dependent growth factor C
MLTLSMSTVSRGKLPVSVLFQSAAEIAELDRRIKEEAPVIRAAAQAKEAKEAARLAEANKPLPKITVTLPPDAKDVEHSKDSIKFTVGRGKAKAAAEALRAQFRAAGWKEEVASVDAMAGALSFSKDNQSLTLSYTDTGMLPSEVSLSATQAELELR